MSYVETFFFLLIAVSFKETLTLIKHKDEETIPCDTFGIKVILSNIRFTLYNHQNKDKGIVLNECAYKQVNSSLKVIIIVHGWHESGNNLWVMAMKDKYLSSFDANIILVDWEPYARLRYTHSFCTVPEVGHFIGEFIHSLTITSNISLHKVQLNGFSLGAHISGYAGQKVLAITGYKVGRINGLDASAEGYLELPISSRLDATDAKFVQAIHTNNFHYGYHHSYGTVDFHVNYRFTTGNCGAEQNGCPDFPEIPLDNESDFYCECCNHVRAIAYFIESITSDQFIGVKCSSCSKFGKGLCGSNTKTIMGEHCPFIARGKVYLNTHHKSPLGLGENGIEKI